MFIFSALTRFAQIGLVAFLLIAYSVNAFANLEIRLKDRVFALSSRQMQESVFGAFYLENVQAFKSVCAQASSLEDCKPLVWRKTKELMGRKLALAVHDGVNELLFRKNNPYVDEVKVPANSVLKSFEIGEKQEALYLDEFLSSYKSEFNIGGYTPALINDHPAFAKTKKLLGPFSAEEANWLFLGSHKSRDLISNKLARARALFEMEWKSFAQFPFQKEKMGYSLL